MREVLYLIVFLFKSATVMSNGIRQRQRKNQTLSSINNNQTQSALIRNTALDQKKKKNVRLETLSLYMYTIALLESSQRHRAYYFQKVPTIKVT